MEKQSLEETLKAITQGTLESLGCNAVTLYTYDQDTDTIYYPPQMAGVWSEEDVKQYDDEPKGSLVWQMLKKDAPHVVEIASDPLFKDRRFARAENIRSCVVIPLRIAERKVGVMFVNYRYTRRFLDDELASIQHFADQAAVTIYNAQLYDQVRRRAEALEVLHRAGQEITGSLDSQEILRRLSQQAWDLVGRLGRRAVASDIWLVEGEVVKLIAAWPESSRELLPSEISLSLAPQSSEKKGVIVRTVHQGITQLVPNVHEDEDYILCREDVQSELAVPIIVRGKVVAVINVEHSQLNAFSPEDVHALELLAIHASIAMQNAQHYEELKRTRGQLAAKTALVWMGMASATWRHATRNDATTIRDSVALIRSDLERETTREKLQSRLDTIEKMAKKIQDTPITAPLSAHEGVQAMVINDFLRERVNQLQRNQFLIDGHKGVNFRYIPSSGDPYVVHANPHWLARAFNLLVDNAVKVMAASTVKELVVLLQPLEGGVKISLADTGEGIPSGIRKLLLQEPIPKKLQPDGAGMGLLLAQTIIQTYGGDIRLETTGPTGTTMAIWLPLTQQEPEVRISAEPGSILLIGSPSETEGVSLLNETLAPFGGIKVVSEARALEQITQEDHQAVLLDALSISDLSALIQQIRARQPNIKILVVTTAPEWREAREFLRLGATDYIDKSMSFEDLRAAFIRILASPAETAGPTTAHYTLH